MSWHCTLCAEFAGETDGNLFRTYEETSKVPSRILAETRNFVAIPSLGQIVEGYVLICSRAHHFSIGAAILKDPALAVELLEFRSHIQQRLRDIYGLPSISFEHGAASFTRRAGSCTDHAHLHIVPVDIDLRRVLAKTGLLWDKTSLIETASHAEACRAYMYYEDLRGEGMSAHANINVPNQMFRRILAAAVGIHTEWDWRQYPRIDRLLRVIANFAVFDEGSTKLLSDERIRGHND